MSKYEAWGMKYDASILHTSYFIFLCNRVDEFTDMLNHNFDLVA